MKENEEDKQYKNVSEVKEYRVKGEKRKVRRG
jgi:hypothetical protein